MRVKGIIKRGLCICCLTFLCADVQSENVCADEIGSYVSHDNVPIRRDDDNTTDTDATDSADANQEIKYGPKKGKKISNKIFRFKITKRANTGKFGEGSVEVIGLKKKSMRKVVINDTVKINGFKYFVHSIGKNAFKNNKKIRQVKIKSVYVKKIGAKAFYNCKKLKKVYIYSIVSLRYGKKAFYKKGKSKMCLIYSTECVKNMKLRLKKAKCKGYRYTIKNIV